MRIELPTVEGRFLRRYKRFFVDVELANGEVVVAHCPNTGSLLGCLVEGARVVLRDSQDTERKLRYVFQAIEIGKSWVNVDTSLPNRAVFEAVEAGKIPELTGYARVEREKKYGEASRIDLLLTGKKGELCYVEVKNTTLADGRTAMFPDSVTERGLKHLVELGNMVEQGHRAVQFFFVSRSDCRDFRPAALIDPKYTAGLALAASRGVELLAYSTRVSPDRLLLGKRLPITL
jgi:sugar fermentation stimulation protein A